MTGIESKFAKWRRMAKFRQGNWILPRGGAPWPERGGGAGVRNHDRRRLLAAHLLQFLHRLLERDLGAVGEARAGLGEVPGVDLERQRQHAGRAS